LRGSNFLLANIDITKKLITFSKDFHLFVYEDDYYYYYSYFAIVIYIAINFYHINVVRYLLKFIAKSSLNRFAYFDLHFL